MKASILIPAYNAAEFIGETLASCVQQGLDCIEEIIVINDHSEDDTRSVVQRFQVRTCRLPHHPRRQPNQRRLLGQESCPAPRSGRCHSMARR